MKLINILVKRATHYFFLIPILLFISIIAFSCYYDGDMDPPLADDGYTDSDDDFFTTSRRKRSSGGGSRGGGGSGSGGGGGTSDGTSDGTVKTCANTNNLCDCGDNSVANKTKGTCDTGPYPNCTPDYTRCNCIDGYIEDSSGNCVKDTSCTSTCNCANSRLANRRSGTCSLDIHCNPQYEKCDCDPGYFKVGQACANSCAGYSCNCQNNTDNTAKKCGTCRADLSNECRANYDTCYRPPSCGTNEKLDSTGCNCICKSGFTRDRNGVCQTNLCGGTCNCANNSNEHKRYGNCELTAYPGCQPQYDQCSCAPTSRCDCQWNRVKSPINGGLLVCGTCQLDDQCRTDFRTCWAQPECICAAPRSAGSCYYRCDGQKFDNCTCPIDKQCSGKCCYSNQSCVNKECVTNPTTCTGSQQPCGNVCCNSGQSCVNGVCCSTNKVCGNVCCSSGQSCVSGSCVTSTTTPSCQSGQQPCGNICCNSSQSCVSGYCCSTNKVCGSKCCSSNQSCVNRVCVTSTTTPPPSTTPPRAGRPRGSGSGSGGTKGKGKGKSGSSGSKGKGKGK